jgi:hypothetical protein
MGPESGVGAPNDGVGTPLVGILCEKVKGIDALDPNNYLPGSPELPGRGGPLICFEQVGLDVVEVDVLA